MTNKKTNKKQRRPAQRWFRLQLNAYLALMCCGSIQTRACWQ